MPATQITISLTSERAVVRLPEDHLFARVRLDDEEENAIIEFYRPGESNVTVASIAVAFDLDAEDLYRLLVFLEAQGNAPYRRTDTRVVAVHLAAALGAFDRAFPGERP